MGIGLKKIVANDYLFSVISRVVGVLTGVIYMILFNRYFGSALKGESAIILNYVSIMTTILDCGSSQAYAHMRKKNEGVSSIYLSNVTTIFISWAIVCVILGQICADRVFHVILLILPIRLYATQITYVVIIESPKKRNTATIVLNLVDIFILTLLMIWRESSYTIMTVFLLGKEVITLISVLSICDTRIKPNFKAISSHLEYVKVGVAPMICILLMEINYRIDILMLKGNVPIESIGIYSLAVSISERVWLIPDALRDILVSKLSKGKDEKEVARINRFAFWGCVTFVVLFMILGKPGIRILFGLEFIEAYNIMCILLAGVLGMIFYKMVYAYNLTNGKQKYSVFYLASSAVINIVGNTILIPEYGIKGAAITSVVSYTICGLLFLFGFCKQTGVPIKDMIMLKKEDRNALKSFMKSR